MRILIAPNHFKHALRADLAAEAIQRGILRQHPQYHCTLFPIADGGDGTSFLLHQHLGGTLVKAETVDPLGRDIEATYYTCDGGRTAIIDMAAASGIGLLKTEERDPLRAHCFGTGMLIKHALENGARKIIIGVGGTATNDGGTGILRALGIKFWDDESREIIYPEHLQQLLMIDTSGMDERLVSCEVDVLCDVKNPFLGPEGATAVFGAQKGANTEMQRILESGLEKFATKTALLTGRNVQNLARGGAAGGAAAGMFSFMHARLVDGINYFLDQSGFARALRQTDLVITGEGSLDAQTLQGKGPFGVAAMAKASGIHVIGLAGRIADEAQLQPYFDQLICINKEERSLEEMLLSTAANLELAAAAVNFKVAG